MRTKELHTKYQSSQKFLKDCKNKKIKGLPNKEEPESGITKEVCIPHVQYSYYKNWFESLKLVHHTISYFIIANANYRKKIRQLLAKDKNAPGVPKNKFYHEIDELTFLSDCLCKNLNQYQDRLENFYVAPNAKDDKESEKKYEYEIAEAFQIAINNHIDDLHDIIEGVLYISRAYYENFKSTKLGIIIPQESKEIPNKDEKKPQKFQSLPSASNNVSKQKSRSLTFFAGKTHQSNPNSISRNERLPKQSIARSTDYFDSLVTDLRNHLSKIKSRWCIEKGFRKLGALFDFGYSSAEKINVIEKFLNLLEKPGDMNISFSEIEMSILFEVNSNLNGIFNKFIKDENKELPGLFQQRFNTFLKEQKETQEIKAVIEKERQNTFFF